MTEILDTGIPPLIPEFVGKDPAFEMRALVVRSSVLVLIAQQKLGEPIDPEAEQLKLIGPDQAALFMPRIRGKRQSGL